MSAGRLYNEVIASNVEFRSSNPSAVAQYKKHKPDIYAHGHRLFVLHLTYISKPERTKKLPLLINELSTTFMKQ